MSPRPIGAALVLLAAVGLVAVGQPSTADRVRRRSAELDARLAAGEVQVSPPELLGLLHDNRVRLVLLDLRDEAEFNLFHLLGARRTTLAALEQRAGRAAALGAPTPRTVIVLMSRGEERAREGWRRLAAEGVLNVYLLAGGTDAWLAAFRPEGTELASALGARWPASRPAAAAAASMTFTPRVKIQLPKRAEGGCGG
ncbi:MAG: rhodanese-like domain-containing protein [Planctomycetota bacterium]